MKGCIGSTTPSQTIASAARTSKIRTTCGDAPAGEKWSNNGWTCSTGISHFIAMIPPQGSPSLMPCRPGRSPPLRLNDSTLTRTSHGLTRLAAYSAPTGADCCVTTASTAAEHADGSSLRSSKQLTSYGQRGMRYNTQAMSKMKTTANDREPSAQRNNGFNFAITTSISTTWRRMSSTARSKSSPQKRQSTLSIGSTQGGSRSVCSSRGRCRPSLANPKGPYLPQLRGNSKEQGVQGGTPPGPAVHSPDPPFWLTTISGRGFARHPLQTRSPLRHGSVMALRKMLSRGKIDFISFHFFHFLQLGMWNPASTTDFLSLVPGLGLNISRYDVFPTCSNVQTSYHDPPHSLASSSSGVRRTMIHDATMPLPHATCHRKIQSLPSSNLAE